MRMFILTLLEQSPRNYVNTRFTSAVGSKTKVFMEHKWST